MARATPRTVPAEAARPDWHRAPRWPRSHAPALRTTALAAAGGAALGCAAGLGFFVSLAVRPGRVRGRHRTAGRSRATSWSPCGLARSAGLAAGVSPRWPPLAASVVLTTGVAAGARLAGRRVRQRLDRVRVGRLPVHTALVATLAFLPLAPVRGDARPAAARRPRPARRAGRALLVLVTVPAGSGTLSVPYVLSWGPVLLVFAACFVCGVSGRATVGPTPVRRAHRDAGRMGTW